MNTIDLGYSTSMTKTYWCHLCKKEFSRIFIENVEVQCRFCGNNFCEEITQNNEDHPCNFQPFEQRSSLSTMSNNSNSSLNMVYLPRNRPRTTSSFLDMLINLLGMSHHEESSMENIINYIMANDTNRYGNPPASKKVVDNLDKVEVTEENKNYIGKELGSETASCSVCKDEYEVKQNLLYLPCKHLFHDDCILPWLKERNSCPTCRHELPTDDVDYEGRKN